VGGRRPGLCRRRQGEEQRSVGGGTGRAWVPWVRIGHDVGVARVRAWATIEPCASLGPTFLAYSSQIRRPPL